MITLASDFGTPYPAAMKAVLCERTDAQLVDIGHDFPRQDVHTAAFWLREVLPYVPPAVHLAVIDPGVGTDRRGLVVRAGDHVLVGPDNGLLVPASRRLSAGEDLEAFAIEREQIETPVPTGGHRQAAAESHTFDGRDLFAPAAAAVHAVYETDSDPVETLDALDALDAVEPIETDSIVEHSFPEPQIEANGTEATGVVLVIDGFGNVVTNLPGRLLADQYGSTVRINGDPVPAARSYARRTDGDRLVTVGSHGYVELAVNGGRGDVAFDIGVAETVTLRCE